MIYSSGSPLDDEVVPAFCTQFLENAVQVNFHGSIAQSQFASDFLICKPRATRSATSRSRGLSTFDHSSPSTMSVDPTIRIFRNRKKTQERWCKSCAAKLPRGDTLGARAHTRGIPLAHCGPLSDHCRRSKQRTGCARRVGCALNKINTKQI
jgi:hypothetical protein